MNEGATTQPESFISKEELNAFGTVYKKLGLKTEKEEWPLVQTLVSGYVIVSILKRVSF
jgi:hypothetical protein